MIQQVNKLVVGVSIAVGLLALATASFAKTINVDFKKSGSPDVYSGTALAPDTGTNWNGVTVSSDYPTLGTTFSGALVDSTNGQTSVTFTLANVGAYQADGAGVAPLLMNSFAVINGETETLTVSGLVAGAKYTLYLYSQNAHYSSANTTFTFGGVDHYVVNSGNPASFIPRNNCTVFLNLTAAGDGTLSGTMTSTNASLGTLNGLQLTDLEPEFSTTINVDFGAASTPTPLYSGTAAAPDTGSTWNDFKLPDNNNRGDATYTALLDSRNVRTPVWLTLFQFGYFYEAGCNVAPDLMDDFGAFATSGTAASFTMGGLRANGTYDLYLYAQNTHYGSADTTFTIGGTSKTAVNAGNVYSFIVNTNYVVFSKVAADAEGTISGSLSTTIGGAFNGLQLLWVPPTVKGTMLTVR